MRRRKIAAQMAMSEIRGAPKGARGGFANRPMPAKFRRIGAGNRGFRGHIDTIATDAQKQEAAATDLGVGLATQPGYNQNVRRCLANAIQFTFNLHGHIGYVSPLATEMADFRLYFSKHSADALSAAWCLVQRGGNATDALTADYDIKHYGILRLQDVEKLIAEAQRLDSGCESWDFIKSYYRRGDRVFSYRAGGRWGYVVLRDSRLVFDYESICGTLSPAGEAKQGGEYKAYEEAGGTEAVLAGKLIWPPPGWINPVTDEMARAATRQAYLDNFISDKPSSEKTPGP